jgi:hypothetical protein
MTSVSHRLLAERSAEFADELQRLLDSVLPGTHRIVARDPEGDPHTNVRPADGKRIPLHLNGVEFGSLGFGYQLGLDRSGNYLKAVKSKFAVYSALVRRPLLRLEYQAKMMTAPIAHWQVHAENGAFSHLLTHASTHRPNRVRRPHELSSLHLPVGGERYRPCLEDLLEFLIVDCGVDALTGWETALAEGRERWRLRQLASAVRDVPGVAARTLEELGWMVAEPMADRTENRLALSKW